MRENLLHNFCAKKHLDEQAKTLHYMQAKRAAHKQPVL